MSAIVRFFTGSSLLLMLGALALAAYEDTDGLARFVPLVAGVGLLYVVGERIDRSHQKEPNR